MDTRYTIKEFANAVGVSHDTVTRWVKLGKVKGTRISAFPGKTSPIFIPASELGRVKKLMKDATQN